MKDKFNLWARVCISARMALGFVRALVINYRVELAERWKERRAARAKHVWTAHRIGGGGVVPLGRCSREKAIRKVAKMGGSVRYVDTDVGAVFYADDSL